MCPCFEFIVELPVASDGISYCGWRDSNERWKNCNCTSPQSHCNCRMSNVNEQGSRTQLYSRRQDLIRNAAKSKWAGSVQLQLGDCKIYSSPRLPGAWLVEYSICCLSRALHAWRGISYASWSTCLSPLQCNALSRSITVLCSPFDSGP